MGLRELVTFAHKHIVQPQELRQTPRVPLPPCSRRPPEGPEPPPEPPHEPA